MEIFLGIDVVEIPRIERVLARYGARFLNRVFTPGEREEAGDRAASLAARFAAKEAAAKALGCGIGPVAWKELEIRYGSHKAPRLLLHGRAAALARELGWRTWQVSLSHEACCAVAVVVALGLANEG